MLKTPYYVIDEAELENNTNKLYQALETYFPNHILGYSFKTNSLPWILNKMKELHAYAEVVSADEYELAKQMGFKQIIYNGPMKSEETFKEALVNKMIVNIETQREIKWLAQLPQDRLYQVGLRVNYDIEAYCPNESTCGQEGGRFGFCYENKALEEIINKLKKMNHVELVGLHFHISSKTRGLHIYKTSAMICSKIIKEYNLNLQYIDIGGGFFGGMPNKPSFQEYIKIIYDELKEEMSTQEIKLIVEPGAAIVASPIDFVTSVIDVKETTYNTFVVTDGSRNDVDPLMSKTSYLFDIELYHNQDRDVKGEQVLCGYTCMEHDRLFKLRNHLSLCEGDRVIYHKVGSYTMCLSPLFINYFPTVYVKTGNNYHEVREKWTHYDFMRGSKV